MFLRSLLLIWSEFDELYFITIVDIELDYNMLGILVSHF